MKEKHGWNTWENYLSVHEKILKQYSDKGIILTINPHYKINMVTENFYQLTLLRLELQTFNRTKIRIKIIKDVEIKKGARKELARTYGYSYHAWNLSSNPPKNLLRYDSPHIDHNKIHHRHDYSTSPMTTTEVDTDNWPHVSDFIEEIINTY